jgi:hypothetical protein
MIELQRETIDRMRAGQEQHPELATDSTREAIAREYSHLSERVHESRDLLLPRAPNITRRDPNANCGVPTRLGILGAILQKAGPQHV